MTDCTACGGAQARHHVDGNMPAGKQPIGDLCCDCLDTLVAATNPWTSAFDGAYHRVVEHRVWHWQRCGIAA